MPRTAFPRCHAALLVQDASAGRQITGVRDEQTAAISRWKGIRDYRTQVTKIIYTDGVTLAGPLPKEFELATVDTAAMCSNARDPVRARELVALAVGRGSAAIRAEGGFEV